MPLGVRGIGYPIKKKGWMWDWRCQTTELLEHVDTLSNAHVTGISEWDKVVFEDDPSKFGRPPITVNIAMENDVHLYVKNNETGEYEHCIYGPGDIVMFNNNTQAHGVYTLNDPTNIPRRALNCYLDVDDLFDVDHDFWNQPSESKACSRSFSDMMTTGRSALSPRSIKAWAIDCALCQAWA